MPNSCPSCYSCGMPLEKTSDQIYCTFCTNDGGDLKPYQEILSGMVHYMMNSQGLDEGAARQMAQEVLSNQPTWKYQENIKKIAERGKKEKWPFPKTFEMLKEEGILSYEVNFPAKCITYQGKNERFNDSNLSEFEGLPPLGTLDEPAFKAALQRNQSGKSSYEEWARAAVAAGIASYRVDMQARTCTYFDKNGRMVVTELVPS